MGDVWTQDDWIQKCPEWVQGLVCVITHILDSFGVPKIIVANLPGVGDIVRVYEITGPKTIDAAQPGTPRIVR